MQKANALLGFSGNCVKLDPMPGPHQHPDVEINFLVKGSMTYLLRGSLLKIPAGCLAVFWAATPHRVVEASGGSQFYWFTIPFNSILGWRMPGGFLKKLIDGHLILDPSPSEGDRQACAQWLRDLRAHKPFAVEAAELEMRARLLRIALGLPSRDPGRKNHKNVAPPTGALGRIERMARFISDHYLEEIGTSAVARAAGLNANYASTLFRQRCGMSPTTYLMLHRAHHAHRLLMTTDRKVIDIAMASGFGSVSRFYVCFEEVFEKSPLKIRKLADGA